ncbi:hypothetical protein MC378_12750 [Polaribacter sp. MSW13]|uniref:Zf-HC2 domain-containing protein n=1 Tax=Polaribacter marinus TaxID=2916838 RepID=A0A9X2AM65_9FLAO|nr:hypothetical protein [Polaribacter marinus]MCI2230040.1 hypothetical protein [Polaribacter marinus]
MKKLTQKLLNKFINSCKKTTELIDKKTFSRLSFLEKAQLRLHKSVCKTCNAYEKRSQFLDKSLENLFNHNTSHNKAQLSEDRKAKILEELKK